MSDSHERVPSLSSARHPLKSPMRSQCRGLTVKQCQLQVPVTIGFIIENKSGCRKFSARKSISCRPFFGTTCTLTAYSGRDFLSHLPPRATHDPTICRVDSSSVSQEESVGIHMSSNDGVQSATLLPGVPDPKSRPPQAIHEIPDLP